MEPLKIPSGCASDRVLVVNALPRDRGGHAWAAHEIAFSSAREGCNPRSPTCIKDTKGRAPPGKPINPRSQRHDIRAHRSEGPDPDSSSKGALGNGIGKRGKKRKRERERETHTHRDRETERQRDRKTERQRDSEAARQRDSETARQRDSETAREREREREKDQWAKEDKTKDYVALKPFWALVVCEWLRLSVLQQRPSRTPLFAPAIWFVLTLF